MTAIEGRVLLREFLFSKKNRPANPNDSGYRVFTLPHGPGDGDIDSEDGFPDSNIVMVEFFMAVDLGLHVNDKCVDQATKE
jgi:hypothetical protein